MTKYKELRKQKKKVRMTLPKCTKTRGIGYHIVGFFHGRRLLQILCFCGDLWKFCLQKSDRNRIQTPRHPGTSHWLVPIAPTSENSLDCVLEVQMMVLFSYFQRVDSVLPKPDGPMSMIVPVSTITAANKEEEKVLELSSTTMVKNPTLTSKRGCTTISLPRRRPREQNGMSNTVWQLLFATFRKCSLAAC